MTHTGQQFDASDPRNVRFAVTGLEKQVNTEWAIDLIAKVPPKVVNKRIVRYTFNLFFKKKITSVEPCYGHLII